MSFLSWLRNRQRSYPSTRRHTSAASGQLSRPRLCVEALEDRRLLSAGALDTAFGVGGKVTTDFPGPTSDVGTAVSLIQADGKIVVAGGSFSVNGGGPALVRYNPNGTLDTTFATGGRVLPNYNASASGINGMAIQADGKIVTVGQVFQSGTGGDFAITRYNTDGSLDTTFGNGGVVTTDFGIGNDSARGIKIQTDGKIVVGGVSVPQGTSTAEFALSRYNSSGSLDTSFGNGGEVLTSFAGAPAQVSSVAIQSDGKIVAAGATLNLNTNISEFALARYNLDGSLDTGFGTGGTVSTLLSFTDFAESVAIQADGKIVAAGISQQSAEDFGLARYNINGSLDAGFGNGGTVLTDFAGSNDGAFGVTIQSDNKIVAAGFSFEFASSGDFALTRYNSDGSLDAGFGNGGKVLTDFGNTFDNAQSVAIQSDGKIVAAGYSQQAATGNDFAVARYYTSGSLDTTFGTGGTVTTNIGTGPSSDFGHGGIALQADGKIVQAGVTQGFGSPEFAVARYNRDGTLDTSFGNGGEVTTSFASAVGNFSGANAVAIQADGKILVVGESSPDDRSIDIAMARYNTDGSLDTNFGTGGEVASDLGTGINEANAVAIQADGKIVVAGLGAGSSFTLARYNGDGTLDTTFGAGGDVPISFADLGDTVDSVTIQTDGKIVAAGVANQANTGGDFALVRVNSNGTLDASFGKGGKVTTDFAGQFDVASSVAVQADGKIVAGGTVTLKATGFDFGLARYNSDGTLDKTFGKNGQATADFGSADDEAFAMALQGDGKIVIAGESAQSTGFDFALARFNGSGTLDATFGNTGKVSTAFAGESQIIGVAIQADGNIVAGGTAFQIGTGFDFAVARYIGTSPSNPIDAIIANVQSLVDSRVLNNGQGNALLVKLQNAIEHQGDGQPATAVNDLQAFINEVNDFINSGILTSAQGQLLLGEANAAIALLGGKK